MNLPIEVLVSIVAVVQILVQLLSRFIDHFLDKAKEKDQSLALGEAFEPAEKLLTDIGRAIDEIVEAEKERKRFMTELLRQRADEQRMLSDLYAMHKVNDADGRPVWYYPRRMLDLNEEELKIMQELKAGQKEALGSLQWIVRKLGAPSRPAGGERS